MDPKEEVPHLDWTLLSEVSVVDRRNEVIEGRVRGGDVGWAVLAFKVER